MKFSLEWLESRVVEQDGCWVWRGILTDAGQPQASMRTPEGRKTMLVRRVVWQNAHDRAAGRNQWAAVTCNTPGCVHPDHVVMRSRSQAMKGVAKSLATKAKIAAVKRAKSKWTQAELQEHAASSLTNLALAEMHGYSHSTMSKIRNGQLRVNYSSPWAGLGA